MSSRNRGRTAGGLATACAMAGIAAFAPAVAQAEETTCTGTIRAGTVDNVRVPDGAKCKLVSTEVKGTVKVEAGATLRAKGVSVVGNVQGENARRVNVVKGSTVGGSVQVVQGEFSKLSNSSIAADILFDENARRLSAVANQVGGNIQAFKNSGGLEISTNTVDGNLQCKENSPAPTGGGNVVEGNKEDQCAAL